MPPTPGLSLLHFRLVEKIGEGGMGEVWRGTDATLGRDVAIKILPQALAADAERLSRFEREAKVLASLDGAKVSSVGWRKDGRELYFTSADGRTLMACDVTSSPALAIGKPRPLFTLPPEVFSVLPAPDGNRFMVMVPVGEPRTSLTLVQNWSAQLGGAARPEAGRR